MGFWAGWRRGGAAEGTRPNSRNLPGLCLYRKHHPTRPFSLPLSPPARGPRPGPPDRAPGAPERPPGPAPRTGVPDRHPGPGPPDRPLGPAARTGPPGRHPDRSPGLAPGTSVPLTPGRTDKFKEETLPRLNQTGESTSLNLRKCLGQRKPPIVFQAESESTFGHIRHRRDVK